MSEDLQKLRLADRAEAILRSDRQALKQAGRQMPEPALLLALVPDIAAVIDLMDAYIAEIAERTGLHYVRQAGENVRTLSKSDLARTFLVVADLTGRDETVITAVYQALGLGRRVLLSTQCADTIPRDLRQIPAVLYNLEEAQFDDFVRAVHTLACSTMDDTALVR